MTVCKALLSFLSLMTFGLSTLLAEPSAGANAQGRCRSQIREIEISDANSLLKARQYVYFLIGAPNAGKGTAGRPFSRFLNLPYVSTGDILRGLMASESELGKKIAPIVSSGRNIPTEDLKPILAQWISNQDPQIGFVMDGSPRRLPEAMALEEILVAAGYRGFRAVFFSVSQESIFARASGRLICSNRDCGESFHREFLAPRVANQCDFCESFLTRRSDDESKEVVSERIKTFENETLPVIQYFASKGALHIINAEASIKEVQDALLKFALD
jgi:adenylate kinase